MTDDLVRLANAALRLGDPLVPPPGTVVAGRTGRRSGHLGRVEGTLYADRGGTLPGAVRVRWYGGRASAVRPDELEVWELPADAPPFESWERVR